MIGALVLAAVVAAPATYRVDPAGSEAGFDLVATMHTVHGTKGRVTGEVRAAPGEAGVLALEGRIDIDAASLATGNSKRDATMHGTSFDVARFPAIELSPERFVPASETAPGAAVAGRLTGALTIRGTTRPVTIELTLVPGESGVEASGSFEIAWADFGIPDPSFLFVRIKPTVRAWFHARLVAEP